MQMVSASITISCGSLEQPQAEQLSFSVVAVGCGHELYYCVSQGTCEFLHSIPYISRHI